MIENNELWDKYSIGDFVVWLFDHAEQLDDEGFAFCLRVYDELIYDFFDDVE